MKQQNISEARAIVSIFKRMQQLHTNPSLGDRLVSLQQNMLAMAQGCDDFARSDAIIDPKKEILDSLRDSTQNMESDVLQDLLFLHTMTEKGLLNANDRKNLIQKISEKHSPQDISNESKTELVHGRSRPIQVPDTHERSEVEEMSPFMRLRAGHFSLQRELPERRVQHKRIKVIGDVDPASVKAYEDARRRTFAAIPFNGCVYTASPESANSRLWCKFCGQRFPNHVATGEHEARHNFLHESTMYRWAGAGGIQRLSQINVEASLKEGKHIPRMTNR